MSHPFAREHESSDHKDCPLRVVKVLGEEMRHILHVNGQDAWTAECLDQATRAARESTNQ